MNVKRMLVFVLSLVFSLVRVAGDDSQFFRQLLQQIPADKWEEYRVLNNEETRYAEYKDPDQMLAVKLVQLAYINRSRSRYNAPPLELDILASRVANRMSKEACEQNFSGHWNTRGEKPYHRYAFAGGVDHVLENSATKWSSGSFNRELSTYLAFMKEGHDHFMAEKAPYDGHKQNCINKFHTHVGIGTYIYSNQFRYYEEFVDRYLDFVSYKTSVSKDEAFDLLIKPLDPNHHVYAVVVYYEPFPKPMTPAQLNRKGGYPDFTSQQALSLWPWQLKEESSTGATRITLKFKTAGLYYVNIYLSDKPYTGGGASTKGKLQGSGIVLRVE
jgi:hypothetical protein